VRDLEELARLAVDCGLRAHKELGPGLLESVYEAVLAFMLDREGVIVERQKPIDIEYQGVVLSEGFRADLLLEGRLIIELKSVERLSPVHDKQLLTYLRLARQPLGLLMNFGAATFREGLRRIVNDHTDTASSSLRVNQGPIIRATIPDPERGAKRLFRGDPPDETRPSLFFASFAFFA
jgi:GxxExxY protein